MAAREKWLAPLVKPRRGPKEGREEGDIPPDLILKLTRRPPLSEDPKDILGCTEYCKDVPARFRECLAEILLHSVILGWAAEHFEGGSRNLVGMFLLNSEE